MTNSGDFEQAKVKIVKKFFGGVSIQMTTKGTPYSSFIEVADLDNDDEDYYSIVMKEFLSPEMILFVKEIFITPTQTMFLNALNLSSLCPMTATIFFSYIVACCK